MTRAAMTPADPCTGAPRRDFLLGLRQCWQNPRRLGWPEANSDEVGQVWNGGLVWDGEPSAEVVPERHSELLAGFHQAQERIPAIASDVAAGSAADLAPDHLGPDVVL